MIVVKQNGLIYEIRFKYDETLLDIVRKVPGRTWINEGKYWTIPKNNLGMFLNQIKGTVYESQLHIQSDEQIGENAKLESTQNIPDIDISGIPFYIKKGFTPFKHQLEFMKYAIDRQQRGYTGGFVLGDQQGLGKTIELINLAIYNKRRYGFKHCLIICCINSSKYNWSKEICDHTNGEYSGYILGSRLRKNKVTIRCDTGGAEKLADLQSGHIYGKGDCPELPYFIIMNVEAIRYKVGKQYPIANELIQWVQSGKLNMIAIDEVHKNLSPSSMQGKQMLRVKKYTGNNIEWIPITGTPIVSRPTDAFLPLKLIDAHNFKDYYNWCREFCIYGGYGDHEVIGYKNVPRLKAMLQHNMLRRLKKDVLDLPPKLHYTEYVDNTPYQQRLYEAVTIEMLDQAESIMHSPNPMTRLLRLRQVNGSPEIIDPTCKVDKDYIKKNAKLARLMELLEEVHERGEKVIVYSNWVEPLRTLYKFVNAKYKTCCFTGTMKDAERQKHKSVFINNPSYTVMLGTIGAMGTTHTFTVAQNIIFYDEPWTAVDKEQAEDRAHRIGTTSPLNIYTLLARDTMDDRVHDIVYGKDVVSGYIVDNRLDIMNNPDLLFKLLGDTPKSTW